MEDNILIVKLQGKFFNAYGENAIVLGSITGYKVKQNSPTSQFKCGFPSEALNKVAELLDGSDVNYKIYNKDKIVKIRIDDTNRYLDYLHMFSEQRIERPWLTVEETGTDRNKEKEAGLTEEPVESSVVVENIAAEKRTGFLKKIFASVIACAAVVAVLCVSLVGVNSRVEANAASPVKKISVDTSKISLCDYSSINVRVSVPSTVTDEDVDSYLDFCMSEYDPDNPVNRNTITDEYCKEKLGVSSVDEFKTMLKSELYSYRNAVEAEDIADDIPILLDSGCILDYSESEYNEQFDARLNQQIDLFINQYCEGNKDLYEERIGRLTVYKTKDELESFLEDIVRLKFKPNIACLAIVEKEDVKAEGDDYDSWLANALKTQNISDKDKFFALYDTPYQSGRDYINEQYLYEKVMQLLSKNVNVIYSDDVLVTDVIKEAESNK